MKIAIKIFAGIFGVAMGLWLLVGLITLWGAISLSKTSPSDSDDVAWVAVKVQKITAKPTSTLLKAEGYPTIFTMAASVAGQPTGGLVKPGDQISVRVKKEVGGHLQDFSMSNVYGLQLSDGTKVLENATPIPTPFGMQASDFAKLIGVPVVFIAIIFSRRIWLRPKTNARSAQH